MEEEIELTAETLLEFRTAIRVQRAAAEAQGAGTQQEPTAGGPTQPVQDNRDGVDSQAVSMFT